MQLIQALIAFWQSMNGHKFNTGAAITILAIAFQHFFAAQGVTQDQAVSMATYIIQAVGAVLMIVGYVHQWIKERAAKK